MEREQLKAFLANLKQKRNAQMHTEGGRAKEVNPETVKSGAPKRNMDGYTEVPEMRTENVRHYRNADGKMKAVISNKLLYSRNSETCAYEDIDTTLTEEGDRYVSDKCGFKAKFGKTDGSMEIEKDNCKVSFRLKDNEIFNTIDAAGRRFPNAVRSSLSAKGEVMYESVRPDTDIDYTVEAGRVKEDIIVNSRQESYEYTFTLNTENVTAELAENRKSITFKNAENKPVFRIPAPVMYDAAGNKSEDIFYALNGSEFAITANPEWINAPERVFPVIIDPTVEVSAQGLISIYCYDEYGNDYEDCENYAILGNYNGTNYSIGVNTVMYYVCQSQGLKLNDIDRMDLILPDYERAFIDSYDIYDGNGSYINQYNYNYDSEDNALRIPLKSIFDSGEAGSLGYINILISSNDYGYGKYSLQEAYIEIEYPPIDLIDHIYVSGPTKTEYIFGECLDTSGMSVIVYYKNGASKEIPYYSYYPSGPLNTSNNYASLHYEANGRSETVQFSITVKAFTPFINRTKKNLYNLSAADGNGRVFLVKDTAASEESEGVEGTPLNAETINNMLTEIKNYIDYKSGGGNG